MSYEVRLLDPGTRNPVEVPRHKEGGMIALEGLTSAHFSVTYNYSDVYRIVDFTVRALDGLKASETIPVLKAIVGRLGTLEHDDYWAPTPGNAGHAMAVCLAWAEAHPDATWSVT